MNWNQQPPNLMNTNFVPGGGQRNAYHPGFYGWMQQTSFGAPMFYQQPAGVFQFQNQAMGMMKQYPNQNGRKKKKGFPQNNIQNNYSNNADTAFNYNQPRAAQKRKWMHQPQNQQQQQQSRPNNTAAGGGPSAKKRQKFDEASKKKHSQFMPLTDAPDELAYEDKLSMMIWKNYVENRQSDRTYAKKRMVQRNLCSILESLGQNSVHIVGSTMNGFGSEQSDCDMCLHITSNEAGLTKRMTQLLLTAVQRALPYSHFTDIQYIPARVPILKFRDRASDIECDLNINNTAGQHNTRLLAMYCRFDWRVRPLGMFVKHWGRLCDIHDASRGRLSSYSFNLMVIQYLQVGCSPPILPALQREYSHLFRKSGSVHLLDMTLKELDPVIADFHNRVGKNDMSLGQCLIGFFSFYVNQVDFARQALSVRLGRIISLHLAMQQMPDDEVNRIQRGQYNYKMFMEEPFTYLNVSRSPFDDSIYSIVKRAFIKTHRFLKLRKDIQDVAPV